MNPAAILALIGDLYGQVAALTKENDSLKAALAEAQKPVDPGPA